MEFFYSFSRDHEMKDIWAVLGIFIRFLLFSETGFNVIP